MNGLTIPDTLGRPPPRSQRSSSISNDRTSLSVATLACPPAVSPEPAYIAPSSASHIVTRDGPIGPGTTNTVVEPKALLLVNAFLDQLLYSFLLNSRSISIAALRPAVTEVLKPRLARDAIASADEELHQFLADEDKNELLSAAHDGGEPRAGWDLNKIWRRTRLRCMVYIHLGDLEAGDEEMWVKRDIAENKINGDQRLSRDFGVLSPPAAIFLTSILEFIGEQVLLLSAEAAYARFESRRRQDTHPPANLAAVQRLTVEVVDIEKLAVNTTFGRLWRSWKKRVRSPSITKQRPSSNEFFLRPTSSLSASDQRSREPSVGEEEEEYDQRPDPTQEAASIPLPTTTYDAREIEGVEFPWQNSNRNTIARPRSVLLSSASYQEGNQDDRYRGRGARREILQRNRSSSLPPIANGLFLDPLQGVYLNPQEDMYSSESWNKPGARPQNGSDPPAVMSIYDGVIVREEDDQSYTSNDTRSFHEQFDTEARNLDKGLDSLTRPSIDSDDSDFVGPAVLGSSTVSHVDNESRRFQGNTPVRSNQVEVSHVLQSRPLGVESRVDSSRMQGHTTENVSLDNRETSIVETRSPQIPEIQDSARDSPVGQVVQSKDEGNGYVPATLENPTSYANRDRSNGASYAQAGQLYGSTPRPQPETAGNMAMAVPAPSPTIPLAKPSVKLSEIRKQLPPVRTGVERASVQRVTSSPGGALESPVGRTSTSSSRELRLVNTSGSNSSPTAAKTKVLGVRGSSDTSRQYATSRRSSEASNILGTPLVKTPEIDETQRSFEQLIKSDETIQFTLTPQSVRETDSPDSARYSHSRTGTAELADFIRTSGPPPVEMGRPSTGRSIVSLKGLNGLRSNPMAGTKIAADQSTAPSLQKPKPENQRPRPVTARSAQGGPREAQWEYETTRDFADFIRSTGPDAEIAPSSPAMVVQDKAVQDKVVTASMSKPRPNKAMTPDQRSASATSSNGRKITKPNPGLSKSPPPTTQDQPSKRTTSKLQAREATYEPTHNEDLLDFLKQGPADDRGIEKRSLPGPVASVVPQNPRVSNNLRERFSDNTRSSVASTQGSALANRSIGSTNSETGLLDSSRGSLGGSPSLSQKLTRFDEPAQGIRKQRRGKDPYVIDSNSEDEAQSGTPKPQRQEESLIDFLNSMPPLKQPGPIIPSAFDDIPNPTIRTNNINKKANLMQNQRNSRTAAITAATPGIRSANLAPSSNPRGRTPNSAPSAHAPQLPPLNSRDTSPHLMSTYNTPSANPQTSIPNGVSTTSGNPQPKAKAQRIARSDRDDNTRGTSDLADFLRNSEPPTQVPREMMRRTDSVEEKEGEGKGIWGRIRKRRGR
ncbi:MAG: hypothetical protein Q9213_004194 [Squamulea squamosa]